MAPENEEKPFSEDTIRDLMNQRSQDEFDTFLTYRAQQVATYLNELRKTGVREGLAEDLARDWAWLYWCAVWWPDDGAPGR